MTANVNHIWMLHPWRTQCETWSWDHWIWDATGLNSSYKGGTKLEMAYAVQNVIVISLDIRCNRLGQLLQRWNKTWNDAFVVCMHSALNLKELELNWEHHRHCGHFLSISIHTARKYVRWWRSFSCNVWRIRSFVKPRDARSMARLEPSNYELAYEADAQDTPHQARPS